ncbi:MAG: DUF2339 domain-containing protein [Propionibacteriaceae bacterium]|nr:DUF2339 domain-containing protein [Propionibacteriaceae bacterium]
MIEVLVLLIVIAILILAIITQVSLSALNKKVTALQYASALSAASSHGAPQGSPTQADGATSASMMNAGLPSHGTLPPAQYHPPIPPQGGALPANAPVAPGQYGYPMPYPAPQPWATPYPGPMPTWAPTGRMPAVPMAAMQSAPGTPSGQPFAPQPGLAPTAQTPGRIQFNENFLGRNLLPLVAAVLGLIGLVFLGILVVPYLSDVVKIIAMFVLSFAILSLGYWLHRRKASVLTQALVGTGLGGVFISVLVTHVYFHAITDIVAFAILAVWIVASVWLSKHTNSLVVAVLAHVGMVASISYGYLGGFGDGKLTILVIYQAIATVTIIVGNLIWVRKMYRFGLFASQAMILLSLGVMIGRLLGGGQNFASSLPVWLVVGAFAIQFMGATIIAYLLFVSCAQVKQKPAALVLALVNSLAWIAVVLMSCGVVTLKVLGKLHSWDFGIYHPAIFDPAVAICVGLGFIPALGLGILGRRLTKNHWIAVGTLVPLAVVSMILLVVRMTLATGEKPTGGIWVTVLPNCSWVIVLAMGYLGLSYLSKSRVLTWIARGLLIADGVTMVIPWGVFMTGRNPIAQSGYSNLIGHWGFTAGLGYLALLVLLAYATWRQVPRDLRPRFGPIAVPLTFVGMEISLLVVCMTSATWLGPQARSYIEDHAHYAPGVWFLVSALGVAVIQLTRQGVPQIFYRLWELMMIGAATIALYGYGSDLYVWNTAEFHGNPYSDGFDGVRFVVGIILTTIALVILIVLQADWIRRTAKATSNALRTPGSLPPMTAMDIISGVGLTIASVGMFAPYDWFVGRDGWPWGYPTSLACMVGALLCVGLGLWSRAKPLRIFGLAMTMVCVLKLVTFDIGSVNSMTRVVAFLGGAVVCFGISALYNYAAKHFDKELGQPIPEMGDPSAMVAAAGKTAPTSTPGPTSP